MIPQLGMGTYRLKGPEVIELVYDAIKSGYRYFDSAQVYRNEKDVATGIAKAIREGIVERKDVFYSTKISPKNQGREKCSKAINDCLSEASEIEYIDLLLLHWPGSQSLKANNPKNRDNRIGSLTAMKEALSLPGSPIRHIGVSNFTIHHLQDIDPGIPIYCNQFELHPLLYLDNDTQKLIAACSEKGIRVQAYSSLGEGKLLDKNKFPEIDEMAKNLQITQAQLLLAWALQKGWMVIPKASSVARLKENLKSVHVELSLSIVKQLDDLSKTHGITKFCWDPSQIS